MKPASRTVWLPHRASADALRPCRALLCRSGRFSGGRTTSSRTCCSCRSPSPRGRSTPRPSSRRAADATAPVHSVLSRSSLESLEAHEHAHVHDLAPSQTFACCSHNRVRVDESQVIWTHG
eukprot:4359842-Pleurochrysis_carterae.AAC.1